jgi:N-acetylneuraminic acid mutarotase
MPRVSFAASEVAGIIYAFGGSGNRIEVEAYNPAADTWTVVAKMPTRAAHFHAVTLNGSIYFAGGSNGASYLSAVMAYTPERTVAYGETMCPSLLATSKTVMPTRRSNMTVGEIGGIIYAVGGYENSARYLATNEAYDPGADKWTSKAPLPGARETRGTNNAVVDGKLYVIGGNARGTCSNLSQAYDPVTDSWITKAPMPTPRCHLAVIALNGLIYALGGTNTNGSIEYSTLEIYDPSNDSWIAGPNMPSPRQDLGAVSLNGVIYAVGGGNPALTPTGELGVLEAYDPVNSTWTTKAPMPTPRMAFAAAVLNGMLIVIGGRNNDTGLATVEAYDPGTDTWRILTSISAARSFLSAVTVNNTIYALGGNGTIANSSLQSNDAFNMAPCPSK